MMPTTQGKAETFNFRVEADLKADFLGRYLHRSGQARD
jgi:hypothetical protein